MCRPLKAIFREVIYKEINLQQMLSKMCIYEFKMQCCQLTYCWKVKKCKLIRCILSVLTILFMYEEHHKITNIYGYVGN